MASQGGNATSAPPGDAPAAPRTKSRRASPLRRRITWAIRLALVAFIAGAFVFGCDNLFYHPSTRIWNQPAEFGLRHEDVYFDAADGPRLHGWFIPAQDARGRPIAARGTVLHFHGNAENVTAHLVLVEWLPRRGYNVLMFDYRGYGRSQGKVTRAGTVADGNAALDYLLGRSDVDRSRIVAYGQSLGGAVAIVVAAQRPEIRAVAVESTFGSYRQIAARHLQRMTMFAGPAHGLAAGLVSKGFDPIDVVAQLAPRPLLVIAAERDAICFPELGRELFEAAGEPKKFWLADGAEHLAVFAEYPQETQDLIIEWFDAAPGAAAAGRP